MSTSRSDLALRGSIGGETVLAITVAALAGVAGLTSLGHSAATTVAGSADGDSSPRTAGVGADRNAGGPGAPAVHGAAGTSTTGTVRAESSGDADAARDEQGFFSRPGDPRPFGRIRDLVDVGRATNAGFAGGFVGHLLRGLVGFGFTVLNSLTHARDIAKGLVSPGVFLASKALDVVFGDRSPLPSPAELRDAEWSPIPLRDAASNVLDFIRNIPEHIRGIAGVALDTGKASLACVNPVSGDSMGARATACGRAVGGFAAGPIGAALEHVVRREEVSRGSIDIFERGSRHERHLRAMSTREDMREEYIETLRDVLPPASTERVVTLLEDSLAVPLDERDAMAEEKPGVLTKDEFVHVTERLWMAGWDITQSDHLSEIRAGRAEFPSLVAALEADVRARRSR